MKNAKDFEKIVEMKMNTMHYQDWGVFPIISNAEEFLLEQKLIGMGLKTRLD